MVCNLYTRFYINEWHYGKPIKYIQFWIVNRFSQIMALFNIVYITIVVIVAAAIIVIIRYNSIAIRSVQIAQITICTRHTCILYILSCVARVSALCIWIEVVTTICVCLSVCLYTFIYLYLFLHINIQLLNNNVAVPISIIHFRKWKLNPCSMFSVTWNNT